MPRFAISDVRSCAATIAIVFLAWSPVAAQTSATRTIVMPDSSQIMSMMANSMRLLKPAQFVLDHRTDLTLTPEQISLLEFLVVAQRDSAVARQARMMEAFRASSQRNPSSAAAAMAWTGMIDEQAIRERACEQSANQAETMINVARDRHAVGAILTPAQVAKMPSVEAGDLMKAMQKP
jgi:hypothetical protein